MIKTKEVYNSIVAYDDRYKDRWIDAWGDGVTKVIVQPGEAFDDTTGDPLNLIPNPVEAGAGDSVITPAIVNNNIYLITNAGNEYDGVNAQIKGTAFKVTANEYLYHRIRMSISDATQSDLMVGLSITDTAILEAASHAVSANVEGIFFLKLDGATTITACTYLAGVETNAADSALVMTTGYIDFEFIYNGASLSMYVNDTLTGTFTSGLPTAVLTPTIVFRNGAAAVKTANVNKWSTIQIKNT